MQQFRIGEAGFKKLRKRMLTIFLPLVVIVVLAMVLINFLGPKGETGDTWWYIAPILIVFYGFSFYRSFKKQKQYAQSFCITISDNEITREQLNMRPLTINFMEIKEIIKSKNGHYIIKGAGSKDVIYIANWIDNTGELEQRLQAFAPIKVREKDPWRQKFKWVLMILAIGMMVALYTLDNKIIVGISGTALTGLMIWIIYQVFTNKNIPISTRRAAWVLFIILASIVYATFGKLTGAPGFH
jgi:hypothetical protein